MNQALTSLIGLANGPVFRRFSFRQVAIFGASLVTLSLFFASYANTFIKFLITFSILYGKRCKMRRLPVNSKNNLFRCWRRLDNVCELVGSEHLLQRATTHRHGHQLELHSARTHHLSADRDDSAAALRRPRNRSDICGNRHERHLLCLAVAARSMAYEEEVEDRCGREHD